MSNYIVTNCPAFYGKSEECAIDYGLCEYCTDCVIKQVIEKCKCYDNADFENHIAPFARGIINMFEIEVIND